MGVAAALVLLGGVTIFGSLLAGIGWGSEGPMPGFFPFWIGLLIVASAGWNLISAWRTAANNKLFAQWVQITQVGKVVLPMAVYVAAIPWVGIYLASALLMVGFMRWLGRYGWLRTIAISIGLQFVIYFTFEKWFLVPLPKGPIEDMLGL